MTALVPFIGSFIIFNEKIYGYLGLIQQVSNPSHFLQFTFLTKLYLLYFGLSALGVGSILFSVSCPDEIKKFGSLHPFVAAEQTIATLPRVTIMVVNIAKHYLEYKYNSSSHVQSLWDRIGFNENLALLSYQTFDVIADKTSNDIEDIQREGDEDEDAFYSYRGYMNLHRWMDVVVGPPSVLRGVADTFYKYSVQSSVDIAGLYFSSRDQINPAMRILVSLLFGFGLFTLSIPTVSTFISIIYSVLSR
jgi:hypothetical protein